MSHRVAQQLHLAEPASAAPAAVASMRPANTLRPMSFLISPKPAGLVEVAAAIHEALPGCEAVVCQAVKKAVGKATGDKSLEAEGRADKAEGHLRSAVGKAKDAVREAVKR